MTKDELEQIKTSYAIKNSFANDLVWGALPRVFQALEQAWAERDALKAKVEELEGEQRRLAVGRGIGALHENT